MSKKLKRKIGFNGFNFFNFKKRVCEKRSEREERKNPMEKETSEKVPSIPKSEDDAKDIPRFLRSGEKRALGGSVALTSYPRSGNSMMRSLLESCTGLITGSDTVRFSFDINTSLIYRE